MGTATQPVPLTVTLKLDLSHVEAGVPLSALNKFVKKSGIPLKSLYGIVLPARTLKHRKSRQQPLTRDESDKLARVAHIYDLAVRVFDEPERALRWLEAPKQRFKGRTPIEMLTTAVGANLVQDFLYQIDEGMFA